MEKFSLLEKAALLRDRTARTLRDAAGFTLLKDRELFVTFAGELRAQATDLERQTAAESLQRPAEPSRDVTQDERKPKKGRGGSNDPEPQS